MSATLSVLGLYNYNHNLFSNMVLPEGVDQSDIVDNILVECAELETLFTDADFMQSMIGLWSRKELPTWKHIFGISKLEYNPIENYDRKEDITDTTTRTVAHSGSNESETSRTESTTGKETNSGTDNNVIHTLNVFGGSDTVTTSDTVTNGGTDTTTNSIVPYDALADVPHDKSTTVHGHTVTDAKTDTTAYAHNVVTDTEDTTTYGHIIDNIGSSTHSGTQSGSDSYNDTITESVTHVNRTHGNIGVTTVAQMIEGELETYPKINIIDYIVDSFKKRFCLLVY